MKVMLEEIARKRAEADEACAEQERRREEPAAQSRSNDDRVRG